MPVDEGALLWEPDEDAVDTTRMGAFLREVRDGVGVEVDDYHDLWEWSVEEPGRFWRAVADHFEVRFHDEPSAVLARREMPGAVWFPGATLNYAEHALRRDDANASGSSANASGSSANASGSSANASGSSANPSGSSANPSSSSAPAVIARSQTRPDQELTFLELRDHVARAATGLRRLGVERGDRVVAYLPNVPETLIAFLATASIGAIWSSCAPEFGTQSVIDRLAQIEPKVLLTVDGYRYGDKAIDRTGEVASIREQLPTLEATVLVPYLHPDEVRVPDATTWAELVAEPSPLVFEPVDFDHPLYILFSSGTTGIPKAIVHGHGGVLLEHLKMLALHHDLGDGDRFFWFTTTGWMMWNYLVSGLLVDSAIVLFDGDPGFPDLKTLWRLAAETGTTYFGVSAPFLLNCRKAELRPGDEFDLTAIAGVGSTGAPLPPEGFAWVYDAVGPDLILASASGGTDVCTAFVAASPLLPVHAGEIACRCLGAKVEAYDPQGQPVIGQRGELVITEPMPSMPVAFWGDPDGQRYREAYFDVYPGVWRHGDWIRITPRGSCVITGRSDATLNRGGVRMGTSEFYRAVEDFTEIKDSLVVHLEDEHGGLGELVLFVALTDGAELDDDLRTRLARAIRDRLSPRHVPDEVHAVPDVPRTLSGKKLEIPVKRMLLGADLDDVASEGALSNPESLDAYRELARSRAG